MTGTELLTRESLLKEIFNNSKIDTQNVQKFLLYFWGILQLGVSTGLIEEAECNFIANVINNAIEVATLEDEEEEENTNYIQIRNYMYLISSYLQSKTNWDAWLEISSIKSTSDVFILINNAKKWLTTKLKDCKKMLADTKLCVLKLDLRNVSSAYQNLLTTIQNAISCVSNDTKFDVKDYHSTPLSTGTYILMNAKNLQNSENFFVNLYDTIYYFCIEISILYIIDAKKLFKGKKREAEVFFTNSFNKVEELNKIYQHKLSELKREYDKNLQICDDKMKLDEEYSEAKFYIEKEWEENVSKLEDGLEEEEILHIEILSGEYSLYDFIKEYAIYKMATKGMINYPSTIQKRNMMMMMLDDKQAISEFLSGKEQLLTLKQINFLKDCMQKVTTENRK